VRVLQNSTTFSQSSKSFWKAQLFSLSDTVICYHRCMRYRRNPAENKDEIVQTLKQLLASTYLLYIQTQGAHWNIMGSDFPQLHTLFQTQYTELSLATDLIAEHIRTYGAIAPASAGEFLELTNFEESQFIKLAPGGKLNSHYLLRMLIEQHQRLIELATHLGEITAGAIHTQNLAADRIAAHEKAVWMLESTLKQPAPPLHWERHPRHRNPRTLTNDDYAKIRSLSRQEIAEILENYGFACYDHEDTEELREALLVNIQDGTIPLSMLNSI